MIGRIPILCLLCLLAGTAVFAQTNVSVNTVVSPATDNTANTWAFPVNTSGVPVAFWSYPFGFNGAAWDRLRTKNGSTTSGQLVTGALTVEHGARWNGDISATGPNMATWTKPAGGAGVHHVIDCITYGLNTTSAPDNNTLVALVVRDGPSGLGPVIWRQNFAVAATPVNNFQGSVCGLHLTGGTNTPMTIEFATGMANLYQNIEVTGFSVQ